MATSCTLDELRENVATIVNQVQLTKDPVYISQDGWAPVILVDADTYLRDQQALMELKRIYLDTAPGVPLPQVQRQPRSAAAVPPASANLNNGLDEPLFPTTTEARTDVADYTNLADNGNPIERQAEIRDHEDLSPR